MIKRNMQRLSLLIILALFLNKSLAKEYIIGVEAINYYPLFNFSASDVSKPSFSKELLSRFFESRNYQYRFLPLPIKRFDKWFEEDAIDFKFPDNMIWRDGTSLDITYSRPAIKLMAGAYVLEKNTHIARHEVRKLGTILGFVPTLWMDEVRTGKVELMEEYSPLSVVKHLLHANVEATNIDENVIRFNLEQLGSKEKVVLNKGIKHEVFAYHLSSIRYPEIIKEFDQYLAEHKTEIEALKNKYQIKAQL